VPREEAMPTVASLVGPTGMKIGAALSIVLAIEIVWALSRIATSPFPVDDGGVSSVANIGRSLFTTHAFAFEVTSILILVAMVGAIVLARRER
jgi:NADH-quinone oxidoreductase subunit J